MLLIFLAIYLTIGAILAIIGLRAASNEYNHMGVECSKLDIVKAFFFLTIILPADLSYRYVKGLIKGEF